LCAERGLRIALICVTDGEGGSPAILHKGEGAARLAEIRRLEVTLSAWSLGIRSVVFMGQPDIGDPERPGGDNWDQAELVNRLREIVRRAAPEVILTHGPRGGYGHPAHVVVHRSVMAATKSPIFMGSIFSFCGRTPDGFFTWHFDDTSTVLIDARPFLRRRIASLSHHQSQIDFFVQPHAPRTLRKLLSALFGFLCSTTEAGRKRVPIGTPRRFFAKFPTEGLALQRVPEGRPHFFVERFSNDPRVKVVD
jgi:LmbE family N-acetylglucosaminyl deacetylase